MASPDDGAKAMETRLLNPEELKLLDARKRLYYLAGAILGICFIVIGICFMPSFEISGIAIAMLFFMMGSFFCIAFVQEGKKAKMDVENGVAERIRGNITSKDVSAKGTSPYLMVEGEYFQVERAFWRSVNVGDDIQIERGPLSKEILKIAKVESRKK